MLDFKFFKGSFYYIKGKMKLKHNVFWYKLTELKTESNIQTEPVLVKLQLEHVTGGSFFSLACRMYSNTD